jgi:hypothetical protein
MEEGSRLTRVRREFSGRMRNRENLERLTRVKKKKKKKKRGFKCAGT